MQDSELREEGFNVKAVAVETGMVEDKLTNTQLLKKSYCIILI